MPVCLEQRQHGVLARKLQPEQIINTFNNLRRKAPLKIQPAPRPWRFAGAYVGQHLLW